MPRPEKSHGKNSLIDKCDALYLWHKDVIYRMALSAVGGDKAWALDILENCMLTAYDNIDKFDDEKSENSKSMMTAILQSNINAIYLELLEKMGLYEDAGKAPAGKKDKFDVSQILIRNNLTADLAKYVEKLTNVERELVFMRYFMGIPPDEISKRRGGSREETEKRIFLVKQKIAKMMTER